MRNSTILLKKKQLKCGCYGYNFSGGYCKDHATQRSTKKRIDKHEGEQEDESFRNLIDDLDAIFSKWVRMKFADVDGQVKCYTCSTIKPIAEMQNGHFVPRGTLNTRWMPENCRPQCEKCNCYLDGNTGVFEANLRLEADSLPDYLKEQGRVLDKPTRGDLKELINGYRFKVKLLQSKLKK
jgi:hypothetical protein